MNSEQTGADRRTPDGPGTRLQKFLSDAGVASRRAAEEMILEGRVTVNGRAVDELPAFIDPQKDEVRVDGARVRRRKLDYWIVHKPKNVVCTNRDPSGRLLAGELLPAGTAPLFPVGRLDTDSTGLLLMTNDGELAQRITHPRYGIPKTYRAEVRGRVPTELIEDMKKGVYLSEGRARASEVEISHRSVERSVLLITLREGRNRQIRRMLARLGYPVRTLKRVQIGPLSLRDLPVGAARRLSEREIAELRETVGEEQRRARRRRRLGAGAGRERRAGGAERARAVEGGAKARERGKSAKPKAGLPARRGTADKPKPRAKPSPAAESPRRRIIT